MQAVSDTLERLRENTTWRLFGLLLLLAPRSTSEKFIDRLARLELAFRRPDESAEDFNRRVDRLASLDSEET